MLPPVVPEYDYADTVMYDEEVLDQYDDANMKDVTYNVILDAYGYMIGIEQNEDPDQYVFLTGIDGKNSNLSVRNADANVIFMDGNMDTVTVNMTKSDIDTTGKNLSRAEHLVHLHGQQRQRVYPEGSGCVHLQERHRR